MQDVTFLFTDIEGSTRLWEEDPERMRVALAQHDAIARASVEGHGGRVVKMTGDGLHAAFDDPRAAIDACIAYQGGMERAEGASSLALRYGLHLGPAEARDGDFYGTVVNRAARIMACAHGGQVLVSSAVAAALRRARPEVHLRDLGRVRLRDLATSDQLFQLVHPVFASDFPPLRSLESTPNNLPQQFSTFIGRERELQQLCRTVRAQRLTTVLGLGGLGKTRLAVQAGADLIEAFPDGVWLLELAGLTEGRDAALEALARTLGVRALPGVRAADALAAHLRQRQVLLVLDNCEHMLLEAATVARLVLESSLASKVLATSREPLRISGEATFMLAGLSVPGPLAASHAEAALRSDSVRLFVERAAAADPRFVFDDACSTEVGAICNRLDGIPLAIELAAARVRAMTPLEIARRLKDRFRLLAGGDPTLPLKQRTLRGLLDWSHDLLDPQEQSLLRRLAAFASGWTLEAAERICPAGSLEEGDVAPVLAALVDKSLVARSEDGTRFRLLETVHHYAGEKLREAPERDAVEEACLEHFLALALEAKAGLAGPDQAAWGARIDLEMANLLAVHDYASRTPQRAERGLRLANALKLYWVNRGRPELGYRLVREALSWPANAAPGLLRAQGLFNAGQLAYFMGRHDEALASLQDALQMARHEGDRRGIASILQPLGMAALGVGRRDLARACLEEAVAMAREPGEGRALPGALNALAQLHRVEGELARAHGLCLEVVQLAKEFGDRETEAVALLNLAMLEIGRAATDAAAAPLLEAIACADATSSRFLVQCSLECCGAWFAARGEFEAADGLFAAALASARETGIGRDPVDQAFLEPWITATERALHARPSKATPSGGASAPDAALREAAAALRNPASHAGGVSFQSLTTVGSSVQT